MSIIKDNVCNFNASSFYEQRINLEFPQRHANEDERYVFEGEHSEF